MAPDALSDRDRRSTSFPSSTPSISEYPTTTPQPIEISTNSPSYCLLEPLYQQEHQNPPQVIHPQYCKYLPLIHPLSLHSHTHLLFQCSLLTPLCSLEWQISNQPNYFEAIIEAI
mmetsp:Transcript_3647/g.5355  ORF Transcript_3647/g.5355 Transcript_3647/m.5355 type:complete len:115 (+) Transcript_3647:357-701(+)